MSNEHHGLTGDLVQDALDTAGALFYQRVLRPFGGPMIDAEEERQDLYAFILERLPKYDPRRAKLVTWVDRTFRYWQRETVTKRMERRRHEMPFDPLPPEHYDRSDLAPLAATVNAMEPPAMPDHEKSELAEALLDLLDPRCREAAEHHIAYGASLTATAELMGVTDRTVSRHIERAKNIWRDSYEIAA